ncbi:MAG TPA: PEP-CTERM sorting domain-containing protein [Kiritimatiellia bacterium]|nr:PEP-CTERM sorting domain-containing protein [Kiritimatiellia bacterium]HRZ11669.1 PEP-CTERM sorting domain-containing protein [Kiritimatiellia bacterium]HSA16780.1 PEP-CTERM sorting domain-containing protein [Kiritimatiellia bacterium]
MKKLLIALMVLGMAAVSQADVIANYTFAGSAATSSDTSALSTAGSFSISAGTWTYATSSSSSWAGQGGEIPVADRATWGTAATSFETQTTYWYFTVAVDANYQLSITGLDFLGQRTVAGPASFGWDVNGTLQESWTPGVTTVNSYSSAQTEGPLTGTVTIGIRGWSATSTGNFRVDNVVLNGTITAIPEPGVLALLGLGLGALFYVRRNRK